MKVRGLCLWEARCCVLLNLLLSKPMYETTTKQLLNAWGGWLAKTPWDYFSTYTFRYDISLRRNESYMQKLEKSLEEQQVSHKIFWVVEPTSNGYQSHSHFLIEGEEANVGKHTKSKKPRYRNDNGAFFLIVEVRSGFEPL